MRTLHLRVLAAALLVAVAGAAPAWCNEVIFRGYTPGKGSLRCEHWLDARAHDPQEARRLEAWVLGYATAYDRYADSGRGLGYDLTNDRLFELVDQGCRRAPQFGVGEAARTALDAKSGRAAP